MTQPTSLDKSAALNSLYARIMAIAKAMGGSASLAAAQSIPPAMIAEPRSDDVPALRVKMPDEFEVDFAPYLPLSVGSALSVRAMRTHSGWSETDWTFIFGTDGWRRAQRPLSDAEISACLTPEGPRPAAY
jgi:hypothetical protein